LQAAKKVPWLEASRWTVNQRSASNAMCLSAIQRWFGRKLTLTARSLRWRDFVRSLGASAVARGRSGRELLLRGSVDDYVVQTDHDAI